jgi:16S rRNA (adenine1518-N6/adenine1519-N6)-dimethyltransferase
MNYLGQHFLKNPAAIKKIVAAINVQPGGTIIEIGPGHAELTFPLAEACKKIGAKIIAIEKDNDLAEKLKTGVANLDLEKIVTIISEDALTFLKQNPEFQILAGNIPYYITGHLLRRVSELKNKPERCVLMIQKEVAERICAEPPKMNRLAASVQFWAAPKIIATLGKGDFSPSPEVESAVIKLETQYDQIKAPEKYYSTVRTLFAQPRKTILNNLRGDNREKTITLLAKLGIDPGARPQNLTIEQIRAIADACA